MAEITPSFVGDLSLFAMYPDPAVVMRHRLDGTMTLGAEVRLLAYSSCCLSFRWLVAEVTTRRIRRSLHLMCSKPGVVVRRRLDGCVTLCTEVRLLAHGI